MLLEPLNVPGNLEFLKAIANFVIEAAELVNLERKKTYKLRLAVDEIATNIIQHGYQEVSSTGEITCYAELDETYLTIVLEDRGTSYNSWEQIVPESLQQPLTERPIGGLGIYLARECIDNFRYQRQGDRNFHFLSIKR